MPVIHIDTSDLTYGWFWVPGHLPHFLDGSNPGGTAVELGAGEYAFQQTRSQPSALRFEVTADGLVDYDRKHADFFLGRGTTTLRVVGVPVTLRGSRTSLQVLPMWGGCIHPIELEERAVRMPPGTAYEVRLGRASTTVLTFDVRPDGVVDYDAEFEEMLSGRGTGRLLVGANL